MRSRFFSIHKKSAADERVLHDMRVQRTMTFMKCRNDNTFAAIRMTHSVTAAYVARLFPNATVTLLGPINIEDHPLFNGYECHTHGEPTLRGKPAKKCSRCLRSTTESCHVCEVIDEIITDALECGVLEREFNDRLEAANDEEAVEIERRRDFEREAFEVRLLERLRRNIK